MSHEVGVWIDHKKAVIVSIADGHVTTRTLTSDVEPHPHYAGSQEGGGEKKYEERHNLHLDQYYDEVISQIDQPEALLLFGPGEAQPAAQGSSWPLPGVVRVHCCSRDHGQADGCADCGEGEGTLWNRSLGDGRVNVDSI